MSQDNIRVEQLLTLVANELYFARMDKEEERNKVLLTTRDKGLLSTWQTLNRSRMVERIEDIREAAGIGLRGK